MADLEITFDGVWQLEQRLNEVAQTISGNFIQAAREELEIEMTEAKNRCPVKTGALRASGTVMGPHRSGDDYTFAMGFGAAPSPAQNYAVEVHENLEMFHPRGGQAKFLESVVLESAPYLPMRIAERMQHGAGADFAPTQEQISDSQQAVADLGVEE